LPTWDAALQPQLAEFADLCDALLGQQLVGVYAASGDARDKAAAGLRLLVVIQRDLRHETKLGLTETILARFGSTAPLSLLVVRVTDLVAEAPAVLVQLQVSETERQTLTADIASFAWLTWPDGPSGSVDHATMLTPLLADAVPLHGPTVAELLTPPQSATVESQPPAADSTTAVIEASTGQQLTLDQTLPP
jgi:hypothetical protein